MFADFIRGNLFIEIIISIFSKLTQLGSEKRDLPSNRISHNKRSLRQFRETLLYTNIINYKTVKARNFYESDLTYASVRI